MVTFLTASGRVGGSNPRSGVPADHGIDSQA